MSDWLDLIVVCGLSALFGLGLTLVFCLAILGVSQAVEARRTDDVRAAAAWAALGAAGIALSGGLVALGLVSLVSA